AGKAATSKVQALQQQRLNELNERNKQLQALQQQLEQGANVLRLQAATELQRKIERAQLDLQRFTEDAQDEVNALTQQLQAEFEQQFAPVITAVAQEKQLHMIFSVTDAGMIWGGASLDIAPQVIHRENHTPDR